jgi:CTP synthase (UTP-ammonia lyase)
VRLVTPIPGTRFAAICGTEPFDGYHYCSFGLDPAYVEPLERAGVVVGATAPDAGVEAIELPAHPFFLATAFQPQVGAAAAGLLGSLLNAFCAACAAS